jgi:hypothetical protein
MSIDPSIKEKFIELRAQGLTYDLIAQELNCSPRTLVSWNRAFKSRINALRATRLEILLDKYQAMKENRIEIFGRKLKAILEVLEGRLLYDIPTDKAFTLVLKYAAALKTEEADLQSALENADNEEPAPNPE